MDNPLLFLTQENAKRLLTDADDSKMYCFFKAGSGLDIVRARIEHMSREINRVFDMYSTQRDVFEKRKRDLDMLLGRYRKYQEVRDFHRQEEEWKQALEWIALSEKEKELAAIQCETEKLEKKCTELGVKKNDAHRCIEDTQKVHAERQETVRLCVAELEELKKSLTQAVNRRKDAANDQRKVEGEMQYRQTKLRQLEAQKLEVVKAIENAQRQRRAQQGADAERVRNEQRLEDLNKQKVEAEQQLNQEKEANPDAARMLEELRRREQELKQNVYSIQRDFEQVRRQLQNYEQVQGNSVSRFGRQMPRILQEIEEANRRGLFKHKPVGPLGQYVNLIADENWANAVEGVIGGHFNTFAVDNVQDKQQLHNILRSRVGIQPSSYEYPKVVTMSLAPKPRIDISRYQASCSAPGYKSFLDCAEVTNDLAFNILAQLTSFESRLLCEDAHKALEDANNHRCRNTALIIGWNRNSVYVTPSGSNFVSYQYPLRVQYLMKSVEKQISSARQQELDLRQALAPLKPQLDAVTREREMAEGALRKTEQNCNRLNEKLRNIDMEVNHLRRKLANVIEAPSDIQFFEEDMQRKQQEIDEFKNSDEQKVLNARLKAAVDQCRQGDRCVEEAKRLVQAKEQDVEKAEEQVGQFHRMVTDARRKLPQIRDQFDRASSQLEQCRQQVEEKECQCKTLLGTLVEKFGDRPNRRRTESRREVEQNLDRIRMKINAREQMDTTGFENIEEVEESVKKEGEILQIRGESLKAINNMVSNRKTGYPILVQKVANYIAGWFDKMVKTRGLKNQLLFDHNKGTLCFKVVSKEGRNEISTTRSIKTLSGGERSMSTVFFLLSIWENSDIPIKGMDEFDVFLDGENRQMAIGLLDTYARNGQFFLLSPCGFENSVKKISCQISIVLNF